MSDQKNLTESIQTIIEALEAGHNRVALDFTRSLLVDIQADVYSIAKGKKTQRALFAVTSACVDPQPAEAVVVSPLRVDGPTLTEASPAAVSVATEIPSWVEGLGHFTGTEDYHQAFGKMLFTDGVNYLAEKAGAFWLIDLVASYITKKAIKQELANGGMCFWELIVNDDQSAIVTCRRDSGEPAWVTQKIKFTDFPLNTFKLYLTAGGPEGLPVLMLPSEY